MYSSNNNLNNGNNLISYPNQPFSFESNQTSKDETNNSPFPLPPLSFFQFPYSPFEDNEIFLQQHDFLLHHQNHHQSLPLEEVVNVNKEEASNNINNNILPPSSGKKAGAGEQIPRKRSSKRDRHSKISTARGLRDRRMRLSLEVAKRFFGLQDMLGFEKASKTVEWLLNQAKLEIKQLAREKNSTTTKSASSTSECEGVSSLDEVVVSGNQEEKQVAKRSRRGNNKVSRKSSFNPISREKARERARERTREKMKTKTLVSVVVVDESNSKQCNNGKNHNHNLSWNPFETVEESEHQSHSKEHSEWSPTMMFNSLNNSGFLQQVSSN